MPCCIPPLLHTPPLLRYAGDLLSRHAENLITYIVAAVDNMEEPRSMKVGALTTLAALLEGHVPHDSSIYSETSSESSESSGSSESTVTVEKAPVLEKPKPASSWSSPVRVTSKKAITNEAKTPKATSFNLTPKSQLPANSAPAAGEGVRRSSTEYRRETMRGSVLPGGGESQSVKKILAKKKADEERANRWEVCL